MNNKRLSTVQAWMKIHKVKEKQLFQFESFKKWVLSNNFLAEVAGDVESIKPITCKVYWGHLAGIRKKAWSRNVKGVVVNGIGNYAGGIFTYIYKSNVLKNVNVGHYMIGLKAIF